MTDDPSPESQDAIGARLQLMRLALGFQTTREWAAFIGVSENNWSMYETGQRRISIANAIRIRRKTGYTLDWIYMGEMDTLQSRHARALEAVRGR